jgi:hypothetical protein
VIVAAVLTLAALGLAAAAARELASARAKSVRLPPLRRLAAQAAQRLALAPRIARARSVPPP